ncbi:MAG: hypothetical protein Q9167_003587 [Letrouitia subvulpina]
MSHTSDRNQYTIGWIAPVAIALTPAVTKLEGRKMLNVPNDSNIYMVGKIRGRYVVMVTLPEIGTVFLPKVTSSMQISFPNIEHILLVGLGGGVPYYGTGEQMVLGDVVVGIRHYNLNRGARATEGFEFAGYTHPPSNALLKAANTLRALHSADGTIIPSTLKEIRDGIVPSERSVYEDPGTGEDHLFDEEYIHFTNPNGHRHYDPCKVGCDFARARMRKDRGKKAHRGVDSPRIHYGAIGSGDSVVVAGKKRYQLYEKFGIICFDMEATGLIPLHNYLVIRGISNYSDSHKNKEWQPYAAAAAAAYAHELVCILSGQTELTDAIQPLEEQFSDGKELLGLIMTQSQENHGQAMLSNLIENNSDSDPYKLGHGFSELQPEQTRIPKSIYISLADWLASSSCPFFYIQIERGDTQLFRMVQEISAHLAREALDRKLPLMLYRCDRTDTTPISSVLQTLTDQLLLYDNRKGNPKGHARIEQNNSYSSHFYSFQESFNRLDGAINGIFFNFHNVEANTDSVRRLITILEARIEKFPASKILFVTEGRDSRLCETLHDDYLHLLRDRSTDILLRPLSFK